MKRLTVYAKKLRAEATEQEVKLWNHIKSKKISGIKFRRQQIIEGYIVDFYCSEKKVVVELDGGQHAESETDIARDNKLVAKGYKIVRIWNTDINENTEGVIEFIEEILKARVDSYRYRRKKKS